MDPRRWCASGCLELALGVLDLDRVDVRLLGEQAAYAAAPAPVRAPNTRRSDSELPPRRLAPCIPPATSPAA